MGLLGDMFGGLDFITNGDFNDLLNNHHTALENWIRGGYRPRSIMPENVRAKFKEYDSRWREISAHTGGHGMVDWCTYDHKRYIVQHRSEILELYAIFKKYEDRYHNIVAIAKKHPYGVNSIMNKYAKVSVENWYQVEPDYSRINRISAFSFFIFDRPYNEKKELHCLSYEEQEILISRQHELASENQRIKIEIEGKQIAKTQAYRAEPKPTVKAAPTTTQIKTTPKYVAYRYPDALEALDAKKQFLREHHRKAAHCFKNTWEKGYIIFDTRTDLNAWYKEHTGRVFYDDEPIPDKKFTKEDAMNEIRQRYGSLIDSTLANRDYSMPFLAVGLTTWGNSVVVKFVPSTDDKDIEYRFSLHYAAHFIEVSGVSNSAIKDWYYKLLYKYYYNSRFKKRIEASSSI